MDARFRERRPIVSASALVGLIALLALGGCWSEIRRESVDVASFSSWGGQASESRADTLRPAFAEVLGALPGLADGSVSSVEELSMFVQLQNQSPDREASVVLVAHPSRVFSREQLLGEGVRVTTPILLQRNRAFQIDSRNYPKYEQNFDAFAQLIRDHGNFYLYVVAAYRDTFRVAANVPTLTLTVAVD